ncbi:MAG: alanine racemase [Solirubrobacterales bacterium]|nr:alanine racemase [Solirubrobacterales bacterium]
MALRAQARVNLAASERNAAALKARLAPGVELCAVVKARASGHGAVPVARAALAGGATRLAVATAGEALELRDAGLRAPVLVLGALSSEELPVALAAGAEVVAWTEGFVDGLARAVAAAEDVGDAPVDVHVKLDTGMGRLGTRSVAEALAVADRLCARGSAMRLAGAMTHFATADGDPEFFAAQLMAFGSFAGQLREAVGPASPLTVHAANSAATVRDPASHFDMVRCGIALHGCDPMNADPDDWGLEPALELSTYVAAVKLALPGESAGYGRRFISDRTTWLATLPIGYADGVRRDLSDDCDVLIAGRRYPLVGRVSMDNVTVDLGPEPRVEVGEVAILIGRSGAERQTVEDLARRLDTINHEVLCGISDRVTRRYHRDGEPV